MGLQIGDLDTEEEREKARRKSVMNRLKGLSSEQLESMLRRMDERETNEMEVKTQAGSFRSGGSVKGRSAISSAEKS
tara:strand:- start:564 stop:794 length:231 start_codon:yes stop_codon:yes gene_type:complete